MYMPGRFRTGSSPSRTWICFAEYSVARLLSGRTFAAIGYTIILVGKMLCNHPPALSPDYHLGGDFPFTPREIRDLTLTPIHQEVDLVTLEKHYMHLQILS